MYYKIEEGTETFRKLAELSIKMKEVSETTRALVKKLGGSNRYFLGNRAVAGGIQGIRLNEKPENWRKVQDNFYFPKSCKQNKEILDEIKALPIVSYEEYNETVGFEEHFVGLTHYRAPGIMFGKKYHLMETSDECDYTAPSDCIEILASEYKKLKSELEAE